MNDSDSVSREFIINRFPRDPYKHNKLPESKNILHMPMSIRAYTIGVNPVFFSQLPVT